MLLISLIRAKLRMGHTVSMVSDNYYFIGDVTGNDCHRV